MRSQSVMGPSDKACDCCGRIHRKLYPVFSHTFSVGKTCLQHAWQYTSNRNKDALVWRGRGKTFDKVKAMFDKYYAEKEAE